MNLAERLSKANSFDEVFELVKRSVEISIGRHRAGLTLILGDLPNFIGAYHILGSNLIVLNKNLLNLVKRKAKSKEEINSYIFTILMHEYLHSLGYTNEEGVRSLVYNICNEYLGKDHLATKIAKDPLSILYPEILNLPSGLSGDFEVVKDFDKDSMSYIG
ncbi:hypothetical protein HRbin06_00933 [archaeon HR06]|nr:hypothetical protein HRbin06_00933 [archaeon HR06]